MYENMNLSTLLHEAKHSANTKHPHELIEEMARRLKSAKSRTSELSLAIHRGDVGDVPELLSDLEDAFEHGVEE